MSDELSLTSPKPLISELVVVVAANARGMVIITWNEVSPGIAERAPVHGRIFGSLKLSTRKR